MKGRYCDFGLFAWASDPAAGTQNNNAVAILKLFV